MIGICLCGARGRMGTRLAELIGQEKDLRLSSALERPGHAELGREVAAGVRLTEEAEAAMAAAEVVLDFSLAGGLEERLRLAARLGKPYVTGVTGLSAPQKEELRRAAERIPLLWSSNMSRGVWAVGKLLEQVLRLLPECDVEIFEIHHAGKADSPSGTALQLAETAKKVRAGESVYGRQAKRRPAEVGIASARGGDVVGEHQVLLLAPGEQVILTHRATSRDHFCRGALEAVRFVARAAPGLYTMDDVFQGA